MVQHLKRSTVGASLLAKAAWQPACLLLAEYISIASVTATYGFALTATYFFFKRQKKDKQKKARPERPAPR
jgi:hypothetical protein